MNIKYVCIICSLIKAYAAKDFKKLDFPVLENKHEWLVHGCVRVCACVGMRLCAYACTRAHTCIILSLSLALSLSLSLSRTIFLARARALSLSP